MSEFKYSPRKFVLTVNNGESMNDFLIKLLHELSVIRDRAFITSTGYNNTYSKD